MTYFKKNIKKIMTVFLALSLGVGFFYYTTRCKLDGVSVCYNKKDETFKIEENASLTVQVESEAMGLYLVESWNTLHPEQAGAIEFIVEKPLNLTQLADDPQSDIFITSSNNAAYILNESLDLGKDAKKYILSKSTGPLEAQLNATGDYFIPNSYTGWSFVYNETMLKDMGVDLEDSNNNGLPDSFETWEKLLALDSVVFEAKDILFPLSFKDQYSFYPFLTAGKWHLNFTNIGSDAGFAHPEFLKGLEFIEFLSSGNLYKEENPANALDWQYNTAFFYGQSPFSILSDWMNFEYFDSKTEDTLVVAPFPSYMNNTLRPKGEVDGYLVSNRSKFPSAAAEVLRILRSPEAAEHYANETRKVFVYHRDFIDELKVDEKLKRKIRAYNYIDPDPVMVLEESPTVLARSFFYEVDFMGVIERLYDGDISAQEAQDEIVNLQKQWLSQYVEEKE